MKKNLLSLAFVAMGVVAFAQKPSAGDKTAEFNLNFQTGTAAINYGLGATAGVPELRLRYFLADDMAVRLKLGLQMGSNTSSQSNGLTGAAEVIAETKTSTGFNLGITPGIEKHFAGTDRLSPFVGAELPIGFGTGNTVEVSDGNAPGTPSGKGDSYKQENGSQFTIGLRLVLGADYYFTDGLYLGVEGGLGIFGIGSTGDGKTNSTTGGVAAPEVKTLGGSSFNLFGATAGGLRLGYKF